MENFAESSTKGDDQNQIDLPPGFRFHPTDEELITHYLSKKVLDSRFSALAIGEADLNKCEPWDLPWKAKMGEKQWYFFCVRDRKYPTGLRTNRATEAGYWKATGKDKEIYRAKTLVGMKKTLVFYQGRAPKGVKSNWVMHEYRLEGKYSLFNHSKSSKNEWVISRVFEKGSSGNKKSYVSGLVRLNSLEDVSLLPPLMDSLEKTRPSIKGETPHVTCFSNPMEEEEQKMFHQDKMIDCFNSIQNPCEISQSSLIFSKISLPTNSFYFNQSFPNLCNFQYPIQDQTILRDLIENNHVLKFQSCKAEREVISISQETGLTTDINTEISSVLSNREMGIQSFEEQEAPSNSTGPVDLDCLWNY